MGKMGWLLAVGLLSLAAVLAAGCGRPSAPPPPDVRGAGQLLIDHGRDTAKYGLAIIAEAERRGDQGLRGQGQAWVEVGDGMVEEGEHLIASASTMEMPSRGHDPQRAQGLELDHLLAHARTMQAYGDYMIRLAGEMKQHIAQMLDVGAVDGGLAGQLVPDCIRLQQAGERMRATGLYMAQYVEDFERGIAAKAQD